MPPASSGDAATTGTETDSDPPGENPSRRLSPSTLQKEPNWSQLSDNAARIIVEIAIPIWQGYSHAEIGKRLGRSEAWVAVQIAELRREIREQEIDSPLLEELVKE